MRGLTRRILRRDGPEPGGVERRALRTLDGVEEIARAEMLTRGVYVGGARRPERADAVCGGREACLIGSLYLAHGEDGTDLHTRPEVMWPRGRERYMADRPALRLAYDALNAAAAPLVGDTNASRATVGRSGAAEAWFEYGDGHVAQVPAVVDRARELIRSGAVEAPR